MAGKCPRCQTVISAAPDPQGVVTCPACHLKLKTVAAYATTEECRSVFIRRYFGEDLPPRCGTCDRCRRSGGVPVVARDEAAVKPPSRRRRRRRRPKARGSTSKL